MKYLNEDDELNQTLDELFPLEGTSPFTVIKVSKFRRLINKVANKVMAFFRPQKVVVIPPAIASCRSHNFATAAKANRLSVEGKTVQAITL